MTLRRRAALVIAGVIAATMVGGAAGAQQFYGEGTDGECARVIDMSGQPTSTLAQGQDFRVIGSISDDARNCADRNAQVEFILTTNPTVSLGGTQADAQGNYASPVLTVPRDFPPGAASVRVHTMLNGQPVVYSAGVMIVAIDAPRVTPPRLPVTGWDIAAFAVWGVFFVGFGLFLAIASWRRLRAGRAAVPASAPASRPTRLSHSPVSVFAEDSSVPQPAYYGDGVRTDPGARPQRTTEPARERELAGVGAAVSASLLADGPTDGQTEREESANAATTSPISAAVDEASEHTSELVSRLQREIRGWTQPKP